MNRHLPFHAYTTAIVCIVHCDTTSNTVIVAVPSVTNQRESIWLDYL